MLVTELPAQLNGRLDYLRKRVSTIHLDDESGKEYAYDAGIKEAFQEEIDFLSDLIHQAKSAESEDTNR